MSYSFSVIAATKEEALAKVAVEMDKVVESQPVHAADREPALAVAKAFLDLVPDDATRDVAISMSGSLGWRGTYPTDHQICSSSVNVYASQRDRS